jgi:hypothetical protein
MPIWWGLLQSPALLAITVLGAVNWLAVSAVVLIPRPTTLMAVVLLWLIVVALTFFALRSRREKPLSARISSLEIVGTRPIRIGRRTIHTRFLDMAVLALSLLSVACWLILYNWFSLFGNFTPKFAIDKIPGHSRSPILHYTTLIFIVISAIYFAIYLLVRKTGMSRSVKVAIVLMVVGGGVVNIFLYPMTALDVFFYLAQIKLAYFYGQNPYIGTFGYAGDPFAAYAFNLHRPLGYPPAWLLLSALPAVIGGLNDLLSALLTYKAFNFVLIVLTGIIVYKYQEDEKSKWLAAYLFLANPLVLFEGVANGHVDAMMTLFLIAAILALRRKSILAAPLLTVSFLIKLVSGALMPLFALVMLRKKWGMRKIALSAELSLAVAVAAFAPFWAGGEMLRHFSSSVGYHGLALNATSIFSLVREYLRGKQVPGNIVSCVWYVCAGLFVLSAVAVMWRQKHDLERTMANILLLFTVLVTMFFPWYLIPVIAVLTLKRNRIGYAYLFLASALGLLHYPLMVWAWYDSDLPTFSIHLFEALFVTLPALTFFAVQILLPGRERAQQGAQKAVGSALS